MGSLVNDAGVTVFEGEIIGAGGDVRHKSILVAYTDIDPATGRAPIITLQPGEWLFASWRVVTEAFNDTAIVNNGAASLIAAGGTIDTVDDALSVEDLNAANAVDGLIGPDPASAPPFGAFVTTMVPLISPTTVAVPLVLDFASNQPLAGDGTAGALVQHLLILPAP